MKILCADSQYRRYEHGVLIAVFIAPLHNTNDLPLHTNHLGRCVLRPCSAIGPLNQAELSTFYASLKLLPHFGVGGLPHTATHPRLQDAPLILHGIPLKDVV